MLTFTEILCAFFDRSVKSEVVSICLSAGIASNSRNAGRIYMEYANKYPELIWFLLRCVCPLLQYRSMSNTTL